MKVYQINCDLGKKRNYRDFYKRIMSFSNWSRRLESCWIVSSNKTAEELLKDFQSLLDCSDRILITRLQGDAAWMINQE